MTIAIVLHLQILFIMMMMLYGDDTFDCTGYEDDSYHPIYEADDCRHYWHCIYVNTVYMHAVKRVCPAGTEFDPTLRQCETSSLVDCIPPKSPHLPRITTTTKAWKWRYSKLFSRKQWKPTRPYFATTRKYPIFDLRASAEVDTTTMIMPELETTEQIQVLPFTLPQPTTAFSLEQLSKNLHALVLNHRSHKRQPARTKLFQIGEPDNEAEMYTSTTKRRTRATTQSTSTSLTTQLLLTTFHFTTETMTIPIITTDLPTITTTTTTMTSPLPSTLITTGIIQPDMAININPQARINSRRNNMTLYILTSDEHKIRRFSVNHTRGILVNCNQLRRRLLGRRRLRDVFQVTTTTTNHTTTRKYPSNSAIQLFHSPLLSFIFLFVQLIIIM